LVTIEADEYNDTTTGCSFREAVQAINNGADFAGCAGSAYGSSDTITLGNDVDPTLTRSAVMGEDLNVTGDVDVRKDLTIAGNDSQTINQTTTGERILHVPAGLGVSLGLNDLTIQQGRATATGEAIGGNVYFQGAAGDALTLNDTNVWNGFADGGPGGKGAGIAATGGNVTIENGSSVVDNLARGTANQVYEGGGVYIGGSATALTVEDSGVTTNWAGVNSFPVPDQYPQEGRGGGIFVSSSSSVAVTLTDATVDGNQAGGEDAGGNGGPGFGAGIYVASSSPTTLDITGGSISSNEVADSFSAPDSSGGGIYAQDGTTSVSVTGTLISLNRAVAGGGTDIRGGGIHSNGADLTITDATISLNHARHGGTAAFGFGGGISVEDSPSDANLTVTGSLISQNNAGRGGGIQMEGDGALSVSNSIISSNLAAFGGGVHRMSAPDMDADPADLIQSTLVSGNDAGHGGFDARGGGLFFETSGSLTVDRSTISANTASGGGASGEKGVGGGAVLQDDSATDEGSYTIQNTTISGNSAFSASNPVAEGGQGGGITNGLDVNQGAPVTIQYSTVASNSAASETNGGGEGGGLLAFEKPITLLASIVAYGAGDAGAANCEPLSAGSFVSAGGNVESTVGECGLGAAADIQGVDPLLGPLAANGGPAHGPPSAFQPMLTRSLPIGSPAQDRFLTGCPATDERLIARPLGPACDSGAFEAPASPLPPSPLPTATTPATAPKKCKKKRKRKKRAAATARCKKKKKKKRR
jgi:hypothetical protein